MTPRGRRRLLGSAGRGTLVVAWTLAALSCRGPSRLVRLHGETMGTTYAVTYDRGESEPEASEAAVGRAIDELLDDINHSLSTYRDDSLVSAINRESDDSTWHRVDAHFAAVFERSRDIHEATGGVFNPAVGPLVDAWGFGPSGPSSWPDETTIAALRAVADFGAFEFRAAPPEIRKTKAGARLDFSAIAKGYGVDQVCALLDRFGIHDYMTEIGGEVRARGRHPDGRPWRVGIERPAENPAAGRTPQAVVALRDAALATSGTYRNFLVRDGRTLVHIVDPATGRPETSDLLGASVWAPDAMTADAYATALMVMGMEAALAFVEARDGLEAYFIASGPDGRHVVTMSKGFPLTE